MPRYKRAAFTKLRCGVLPLEIETGRYSNVKYDERLCKLCNKGKVENEEHFLLECELYEDLRSNVMQQALELDNDFSNLNNRNKLCF